MTSGEKRADRAPEVAWLVGAVAFGALELDVEVGAAVVVLAVVVVVAAVVDDVLLEGAGAVVGAVEVGLVVVEVRGVVEVVGPTVVDGARVVVVTTVLVVDADVVDAEVVAGGVVRAGTVEVVVAPSVVVVASVIALVEIVRSDGVDSGSVVGVVAVGFGGGVFTALVRSGCSSGAEVSGAAIDGEVLARAAVIETASPIWVRRVVEPSTTVGVLGEVLGTTTRRLGFCGEPRPHALRSNRIAIACDRFPRRCGVSPPAITGTVPDKSRFCHP